MTVQQGLRAASLRGLCGGAVHLPADPAYDMARAPWNLRMSDNYPAAVAYPAFPEEVAEVVRAAAAAGLSVAPQGTGHGAPALDGRLAEAVLLRTSAMTELRIDPENRTARVGAGVLWGDVAEAAGRHAAWPRCTRPRPTSGVVGYSSVAASDGTRGDSACSATPSPQPSSSSPTARSSERPPTANPTCSGPSAAAARRSVSSARSSSTSIRSTTVVAGFLAWDWTAVDQVLPGWVAVVRGRTRRA